MKMTMPDSQRYPWNVYLKFIKNTKIFVKRFFLFSANPNFRAIYLVLQKNKFRKLLFLIKTFILNTDILIVNYTHLLAKNFDSLRKFKFNSNSRRHYIFFSDVFILIILTVGKLHYCRETTVKNFLFKKL